MSSIFGIDQFLKWRASKYTIMKEIQDTVWYARNCAQELVVIKSVWDHLRVENERDPSIPTTIVLKHSQEDLLEASVAKKLNRRELKYMSRCVLEAIKTLHDDGFVHASTKVTSIGHGTGDIRFSEVQLGDLGGCYPTDSEWTTFGTMLISLIYGGHFNFFRPKGMIQDDEWYSLGVIDNQFKFFAPYPAKIAKIAQIEAALSILYLVQSIPHEKTTTSIRAAEKEVTKRDNVFISKMMKLDRRDRPTAKELVEDDWLEKR
ncbi:putative serine/threonine protein kinase [Bipolaris maydis]|nr:putative serine/threonine protein kinase [Bipolaris maydis]KAJ6210349.1 putative serine/threonine protein kinase [Bipolaris maydis]